MATTIRKETTKLMEIPKGNCTTSKKNLGKMILKKNVKNTRHIERN